MKIAVLGVGTVGSGVFNVIQENQAKIQEILGEPLTITYALDRRQAEDLDVDTTHVTVTDNIEEIYNSDVDVVVETMGGLHPAGDFIATLLSKGKHVVTANKDLLANRIDELVAIANEHNTLLLYEASVGGGIPLLNGVETGLAANQITSLTGILNGTSNYILSKMDFDHWSYEQALQEAQVAGFAEADPTNDVEGYDVQFKIAVLSRLAFGLSIDADQIQVSGISNINSRDVEIGNDMGLTVKLIAKGDWLGEDRVSIQVAPMMLTQASPLANVHYAQNGAVIQGNAVGQTALFGPGAGSMETASAIVSDVMQIAKRRYRPKNFTTTRQARMQIDERPLNYYVRFKREASKQTAEILEALGLSKDQIKIKKSGVALVLDMALELRRELEANDQLAAIYQIEGEL